MKTKFYVGDLVRVIDENDEYYGCRGTVVGIDCAGCHDYCIKPMYRVDIDGFGEEDFGEDELCHDVRGSRIEEPVEEKPSVHSKLDEEHTAFIRWMQKRHDAGRVEYGDSAYSTPTTDTIEDMQEELLDFANYAAYLHGKLERMKQKQIEMVRPLMDQVVMVRGEP